MQEVMTIVWDDPSKKGGKDSCECFWKDNDIMFPPSLVGMSDGEAALCIGYDGIPCTILDGKYMFVPSIWLEKERPDFAGLLDILRDIARENT